MPFQSDLKSYYTIYIECSEEYEIFDHLLFHDDRLYVYREDHCLETRQYINPINQQILATTKIYQDHSYTIFHQILSESETTNFLYTMCLGLDKIIYLHHSYVLHSSSILVDNQMILFSAPSGTGKSTQADLWNQYRNVKIINGDRNLIYKDGDTFYAQGWVLSGSSEHRENINAPIRCIVMLEKGLENKIIRLTGFQALNKVYKEIITNTWDHDFINELFDFLELLIEDIPILYYQCTKEKDAVTFLENYLEDLL